MPCYTNQRSIDWNWRKECSFCSMLILVPWEFSMVPLTTLDTCKNLKNKNKDTSCLVTLWSYSLMSMLSYAPSLVGHPYMQGKNVAIRQSTSKNTSPSRRRCTVLKLYTECQLLSNLGPLCANKNFRDCTKWNKVLPCLANNLCSLLIY